MAMWLRQSTTVNVKLGPAVSQSDGVTEKTALSPTVNLSKNGGTIAARSSATAIAHDANGWYTVELNTTDTGTLGRLQVYFRDPTNQLPVWETFMVLPAVVYDALVAGSDNLDVSLVQWLGSAPNALQSGRVDSYVGAVAAGVIAAASFAAGALDAVWSTTTRTLSSAGVQAIWDALTSALTTANSIGKRLADNIDAAISSRSNHTAAQAGTDAASKVLATPANLLATDAAGKVLLQATQTGVTIPTVTTVTNLTNAPTAGDLTAAMKASVNAEVVDALAVDTYAEPAAVPSATSSLKDKIGYLFAKARNKMTQTSTTQKLRNDADSADIASITVSDDGTTFTKGKDA